MPQFITFIVDGTTFPETTILKSAYVFSDRYYVDCKMQGNDWKIKISSMNTVLPSNLEAKFRNELIAQLLRYRLSQQNSTIREIVLGRALYSSYIDAPTIVDSSIYDPQWTLDGIAESWFETYGLE